MTRTGEEVEEELFGVSPKTAKRIKTSLRPITDAQSPQKSASEYPSPKEDLAINSLNR